MRQDEFYNLAGSESGTLECVVKEKMKKKKIFGSSHAKMSLVLPSVHTWKKDRRVNTTSWPCARQHTTKTTCSVPWAAATRWLTGHAASSSSQRSSIYWGHETGRPKGQLSSRSPTPKPTAQSDATVNKAKYLNRIWSRRSFHEMWSQHWYDHFLHSKSAAWEQRAEAGRHSEVPHCVWLNASAVSDR